MKYLLLSIALFITNITTFAQKPEKLTIAILPFQYERTVNPADAQSLAQKVESAFINSKRFTVIERTNFEQIFQELETQKNEVYLNSSKLAKQGELIGAGQLVVGHVAAVSSEGTSFSIKIVDIATGETVGSRSISDFNKRNNANTVGKVLGSLGNQQNRALINTASSSIGGALLNIDKEIEAFINDTYALTFEIVQITKTKGEEAVELMIVGGILEGLSSGTSLEIIREHIITAGTKQLKQKAAVGKIKVDKVQGDVTLCKVLTGGKDIQSMFSPNSNLYASTITKK